MIKLLTKCFFSLMLLVSVAACGGGSGDDDSSSDAPQSSQPAQQSTSDGVVESPENEDDNVQAPLESDVDKPSDEKENEEDDNVPTGLETVAPGTQTPDPETGDDDGGDELTGEDTPQEADESEGSDSADQPDQDNTHESEDTQDNVDEAPASGGDDDSQSAGEDTGTQDDVTQPENDSDLVSEGDRVDRIVKVELSPRTDATSAGSPRAANTFGQVFKKGDVPADMTVAAFDGETALQTQVDSKAYWSDGSLRHAVVTVLPESGTTSVWLYGVEGAVSNAQPIDIRQVLSSNFDATFEATLDGAVYRASARSVLSHLAQSGECDSWSDACKQWLSGPMVSEWIVAAPLVANAQVAERLRVYFHVRAYANEQASGISSVRVDTVVENTLTYLPSPRNREYSARLAVGAQTFTVADLTHYRHARWHKALWYGDRPAWNPRLDVEYLQGTRAISNYAEVAPTEKFLDSRAQTFPLMTNGDQTLRMGNAGAQSAIGPLPRWTSTYVVSGDERALGWMLANDDAVGSYAFHYRDEQTGRPLKITDHPYITLVNRRRALKAGGEWADDLLPACDTNCDNPNDFDIAHHPSIGYVPYLVTGDFYYLEELQFVASYIQLWANPEYRDFEEGRLIDAQGQVRAQAWSLRSISDAAFATPDNDPMKSYFVDQIDHIVQGYIDTYVEADDDNPLHVIDNYGATIYTVGGQKRSGIGPWQADFLTWAMGHLAEQEVPGAARTLRWLSIFPIGRMTQWQSDIDGKYCWIVAATYALQIRPAQGAPNYPNLETAYRATHPGIVGLDCNSQEMANALSSGSRQYDVGEMIGYAHSATGFPSNMQIGLAMAVDSGGSDSQDAWAIFDARPVQPDYSNYPNFAVKPRSVP